MTRRLLPYALAAAITAVVISFIVYTQQMSRALRMDAVVFGRIYALTFQAGSVADTVQERRLTGEVLFEVLREVDRLEIPVVLTVDGNPTSIANLPFAADLDDPDDVARVRDYVAELDSRSPPVQTEYGLQIHFGEPSFLRRLKWVPWLQASILIVLVGGGAWVVFASLRSERERIWSAMARESAHQMGTPLSSLVGWLEQLERGPSGGGHEGDGRSALAAEMKADTDRLLKVSRRFELIGRPADLEPVNVVEVAHRLQRYFGARLPSLGSRVTLVVEVPETAAMVQGNETLIEWAFENLIKNALDALAGREGEVVVRYDGIQLEKATFRVYDTGPGVPLNLRKRIFDIGFSTKERGWGVGLSLTRRIIEDMHDGTITLEHVESGASFRIELPIANGSDGA